jgi:hypothetical protein
MDVSARSILLADKPQVGLLGSPVLDRAGKTVAPSLPFSLADLGGEWGLNLDDNSLHSSISLVL